MADENPDSELWGEVNTDLESFLAARTNTNEFSKKRSRSQDDQKENNTLTVRFNEVFGREDVAKGNILWDFTRRKTIQLRLCNISFPSRSRGYEKTVIQLTLSGEIEAKSQRDIIM